MSLPADVMSERWITIGRPDDIPVQGSRLVLTPDETIAVFKTADGRLFALEDRCPHKNGPLSEGMVHGDCVACPLHGMRISLTEGHALAPDEGQVKRYPLRVERGELQLGLTPL